MLKPIGFMFGMIGIALIFFFFVIPGEDQLLDSLVSTGPDITLDAWRESFRYWAAVSAGAALLMAMVWFVWGQWVVNLNYWTKTNRTRTLWFIFLIVSLVGVVPAMYFTPAGQEWGRLSWVFYLANNLAVFYLATLFLSPSSFKYMPWGAMAVRRW
ncbi:MAG: hypothetical protein H7Z16_13615 [Pyrinomonadaceae bacterium]|nr:hypothetical protein [Pyrinomonadaceae bacterium]